MIRMHIRWTATFLVLAYCSCIRDTVRVEEPVIIEPDNRQLRLAGKWDYRPAWAEPDKTDDLFGPKKVPEACNVEIQPPDEQRLHKATLQFAEHVAVEFKLAPLNGEPDYAIAEIHSAENKAHSRFLAVLKIEPQRIYLWWIEGKKIAAKLHANGASAVVERSLNGTKVYAKPQELLTTIRKHSRELVGKPDVLVRVGDTIPATGVEKIPEALASWELLLKSHGGHPTNRLVPFTLKNDGMFEFQNWTVQATPGIPKSVRGRLSDADRDAVMEGIRLAFRTVNFDEDIGDNRDSEDMPDYKFQVTSGSRSAGIILEISAPARMGFATRLANSLKVVNRELNREQLFLDYADLDIQQRARPLPRKGVLASNVATQHWTLGVDVFKEKREWHLTLLRDQQKQRGNSDPAATAHELKVLHVFLDDYKRNEEVTKSLSAQEWREAAEPIQLILNDFQLGGREAQETRPKARVKISMWAPLRSVWVEFPVDDSLPTTWRSCVMRILEFAHQNDESVPNWDQLST